mmetsp:Transcript_20426/g.15056  ORF Transcript_20426/g.15056 Transcript_20426/m.15056 type:complete len:221 (-) Transcript_20426:333-995(-)
MCAILAANIEILVFSVVWIRNHRVDPFTLVCWIVNHTGFPWSSIFRVVDQWRLPLSIFLVIPIFWFLCFRIRDFLWNIVPTFWLLIFRICNLFCINPISRLRYARIFNLARSQEIPTVLQCALANGFLIDENFESIVRLDMQSVQMSSTICFDLNFILDQQIVILWRIVENYVGLSVARTADVRTKHDLVRGVATKFRLVHVPKKLNVSTSTVNILLVLH